ncbi:PX-SNX-like domain protein (macronuclear) [Tetrahymena thermophila SB210]|uniref:PX-SNX-like domain protein n=1 Tax=Tetrahymena thermophila (strain SB210) TaxID=312017 RepID=I7MHN6_TETTS|nr:PX-SNX-like domain protein [Tetrahymena thermophila SB210]EAS03139.2 PX-SNX-like domain protein [Tetrahymena thermophila SB210]|eukprot:XP_001023384.2 PX-SNX-like domain protein [Tetrahymena thermophila SB210]
MNIQEKEAQLQLQKADIFEAFKQSSPFILSEEDEKFYQSIISKKLIVQVEIYDTKDIQRDSKKQYTVYKIKVTTRVQSYTIEKRFSEFKELQRKLVETYKNAPLLEKIIFNRFSQENILKRKNQLQEFINYFFDEINRGQTVYPFLQFLQILEKFQEFKILLESPSQENQADSVEKIIDYQTNVSHEKKILELLKEAQTNKDNLNKTLQNIGDMISMNNPITDYDLIKLIMEGTYSSSNKNFKGLLQLCGQLDIYTDPQTNEQSLQHINCGKNLEILNNIMECMKNQSYELFTKIFQEISVANIKTINLEQHILSEKSCKQPALKLISKYLEGMKRMYGTQDVKYLLQTRKILQMKGKTINEIENFMSSKHLTLKKVQSSCHLHKFENEPSTNRFSQSNYLSFSYLDCEEDKNYFNTKNIKDVLEDQFIQWKTVYHLKERQIILQHAFPIQYIKMSVVLPVNPKECLDLIVTQRNQWDTLLLDCYTLPSPGSNQEKSSPTKKKEKYGVQSIHDYVCETYRYNFNHRISFYSERKTEIENKRIYITRTSYDPKDHCYDFIDKNKNNMIGKWECLVFIKQIDSGNMTSSIQSQSSIQASPYDVKEKLKVFTFSNNSNINNNLPKLGKFFSGKDLVQSSDQLSKSGQSNSSDDLNKLADISNSGMKFNEYIQEEEDCNRDDSSSCDEKSEKEFFQITKINSQQKEEQKNKIHSGLLSLEESKAIQDAKQNQQNDGQETLPNTLHQQNNSYLEQSNFSQRKKSNSKLSKKEIIERESENDDSEEYNNVLQKSHMSQSQNLSEQQLSKQITPNQLFTQYIGLNNYGQNKDQYDDKRQKEPSSLSDASGCSINFINSAKSQNLKKFSDDIQNTELEDSILIDPEQEQAIPRNQPIIQEQNVNTLITFTFNLQNSEAVHFFSRFINERDDDTMVQSMIKLQDLAKKIRKESSSTTDTKHADRKQSSNSQYSQNSEQSKIYE